MNNGVVHFQQNGAIDGTVSDMDRLIFSLFLCRSQILLRRLESDAPLADVKLVINSQKSIAIRFFWWEAGEDVVDNRVTYWVCGLSRWCSANSRQCKKSNCLKYPNCQWKCFYWTLTEIKGQTAVGTRRARSGTRHCADEKINGCYCRHFYVLFMCGFGWLERWGPHYLAPASLIIGPVLRHGAVRSPSRSLQTCRREKETFHLCN